MSMRSVSMKRIRAGWFLSSAISVSRRKYCSIGESDLPWNEGGGREGERNRGTRDVNGRGRWAVAWLGGGTRVLASSCLPTVDMSLHNASRSSCEGWPWPTGGRSVTMTQPCMILSVSILSLNSSPMKMMLPNMRVLALASLSSLSSGEGVSASSSSWVCVP